MGYQSRPPPPQAPLEASGGVAASYIYSNEINDFGIADIGNNVIFIPGIYFLSQLILKKPIIGTYKDIIYHTFFLIVIEILSFFVKGIGTFDSKDILGLIIGAGITYLIVRFRTENLTSDEGKL